MARRNETQPFNQNDTGRMAYRHEWEPPDERPLLIQTEAFWADESERMTYEDACAVDRPREADSLLDYLSRISATVSGKYGGVLPRMRRPGGTRRERERQLQKLRGQLPGRTEIL